jgi:hypothetical protein
MSYGLHICRWWWLLVCLWVLLLQLQLLNDQSILQWNAVGKDLNVTNRTVRSCVRYKSDWLCKDVPATSIRVPATRFWLRYQSF